jgi:putative radical SAM enzyme (TIGR03279 family)
MRGRGIRVVDLDPSVEKDTGIRPGDRVLRVDGHPVEDELDYRFHAQGDCAEVEVQPVRGGQSRLVQLTGEGLGGLGFAPMRARRCRNRCLFCFLDQMPGGLRSSLYVKDEDYRFSFLYGNYVTLASIRDEELNRICRLKLHPLYVSVHATEQRVRDFLLGRKKSRNIMETLRLLAEGGITLHTQVVLCPGINDGEVLDRTVQDLASLHPAVASIAIVPVGLTRYRRERGLWPLRGVGKREARKIILKTRELQLIYKEKYNDRLVFLADEFYRRADLPFPPARDYQDFPQWENGVGMLPMFLEQVEKRRQGKAGRTLEGLQHCLVVTGELAYPFVLPYVQWLETARGASLTLLPVLNRFFGRSVNVTGLITGRDILKQARPHLTEGSLLFVPEVMLNREEDRFLDEMSLAEMEEALSVRVEQFWPHPAGFERVLRKNMKGL